MSVASLDRPDWRFPRPFGWRTWLALAAGLALLGYSGQRLELGRMWFAHQTASDDRDGHGLGHVLRQLAQPHLAERRDIRRIDGFDPAHLPPFARLERVQAKDVVLNPQTLQLEDRIVTRTDLVEPFGYAIHVLAKMVETLEIALWGTVLAAILGLPLGLLAARSMMPLAPLRLAVRSIVSFLRALPEMISALLLVIAYGFGPVAGFLALGLHGAGVLGRFFAEEIEHADPRPQEALTAIGAHRLAIWRLAVLPQVAPQHVASILYVFDRNVRMATVIGLVGAGGIGQELMGRYDMYEYGHVGTILIAIFLVVLLLDHLSARLRRRLL